MQADVIFSWFSSSKRLTDAVSKFQRPTVLIEVPAGFILGPDLGPDGKPKQHSRNYDAEIKAHGASPLRAICKDHGIEPQRVCLIGFSQGCQGVRAALRGGEGNKVDSVIAVDGTHSTYSKRPTPSDPGAIFPVDVIPYLSFARLAITEGRLCVVTTSSIEPGGNVVSTTNIANWLWRQASGGDVDHEDRPAPDGVLFHVEDPPAKVKYQCQKEITYVEGVSYRYRNKGGLSIINYADMDPTGCADHIYQALYVLPMLVERYLAPRWNATPPSGGVCLVAGVGVSDVGWSDPVPPAEIRDDGSCPDGYYLGQGNCPPKKPCPDGQHLVVDEETYPSRPNGVCVQNQSPLGPSCSHPEILGSAESAGDALSLPDLGEESAIPFAGNDAGPPGTPGRFPRDRPVESSNLVPAALTGIVATLLVLAAVRHKVASPRSVR